MLNAQRMLGGLLSGSLGRGMPGGADLAIGMGVLGVAIAAYEHYSQQRAAQAAVPLPAPSPSSGGVPPPPPPSAAPTAGPRDAHHDAILLIRAMIAAASADGVIDEGERARILGREGLAHLSVEEQAFLARELGSPAPVDALVAEVGSGGMAEQFYLVSLLAITLDSNANRVYIKELAGKLALDPATVGRLHTLAGVPQP